jgi:uncharacterized membrane protein YdbT with pleckstrin-like domain
MRAKQGLLVNEKIVYFTRLHWKMLVPSILLIMVITLPIIFILLKYSLPNAVTKILLLLPALFPLVFFGKKWLERNASEFVVTNMRVIIYLGVLSSTSFEVLLNKIGSVKVDQNLTGKMFGFGTLEISSAGGPQEKFANIQNPFEFRKNIEQQMQNPLHDSFTKNV